MEKSKVYFTREITPEAVVRMMNETGGVLTGNVAVKLHS
ncbi:MAG: ferredoxin, partial [Firmicutes bacterium]|nr:ferredoxin [Bacillota bacterium]